MIRVSQWAEIRQMHMVQQVAKKEVARRLGVDIKTVRRALQQNEAPVRRNTPRRGRRLDEHREQIARWLKQEPKLTAKRIGRMLVPVTGPMPARTVRAYVAELKAELFPRDAYVHRTGRMGESLEVDFGETRVVLGGREQKVKYFVATLPYSNVYFAKAYPAERLECLMDGLNEAFRYLGGVPERVVFDNTSLAVRKVLAGRDRDLTMGFDAFRGAYPFVAEFCAPAKGWEKGSVEGGVKYVRSNVFRPMLRVPDFASLNATIVQELEADLDGRTVADGRSVREAWRQEREHLRPVPVHVPEASRTVARVADKYGHVREDHVHYSVPSEHAYRAVWVKLYHDRVRIVAHDKVLAEHRRSFKAGDKVIDPMHVLPLLERKSRAASEATAIRQWELPETIRSLRYQLREHTRNPDREWVRVLRLLEDVSEGQLEAAAAEAIERGSPRLETIRQLLRYAGALPTGPADPVPILRPDLARLQVLPPSLAAYDTLWSRS